MQILDIGAGIRFADPDDKDKDLAKEEGGVQEAQLRWLYRNTIEQLRALTGFDGVFQVDGVDLSAPESFTDQDRGIVFTGYSREELQNGEYPLITWFHPNPWDVFRVPQRTPDEIFYGRPARDSGRLQEFDNPLELVLESVQTRLPKGGILVLETDMDPPRVPDMDAVGKYELIALRERLEAVLTETDQPFRTNEPWTRFSCVYMKN